jgi:hypothetical protein
MSIMRDLNYLKKLSVIPCAQAGPLVVIETGVAAAAPALLELFQPDCNDIIKSTLGLSPFGEGKVTKQFFGQGGGRGRGGPGHGRRGSGWITGVYKPLQFSPTGALYQLGYFQAEKVLRFIQVVDVTVKFLVTWQSMIYQMQQCETPSVGSANGTIAPFLTREDWSGPMLLTPYNNAPGVQILFSHILIAAGLDALITWQCSWDSWPIRGKGGNASQWLIQDDAGPPLVYTRTNDPDRRNGLTTGGAYWHSDPLRITPTKYTIWNQADSPDGWIQPVASNVSVSAQGLPSGVQVFGCKLKPVEWPFPSL